MNERPGQSPWVLGLTLSVIGLLVFVVALYPLAQPRARAAPERSQASTVATGASASNSSARVAASSAPSAPAAPAAPPAVAPYAAPPHQPFDAKAPPYNPADVVDLTVVMDDRQIIEVAPDTYYEGWTFNGSIPGPVIRVKQGATVNVTLINEGRLLHSLDFHSARTPISNYRNVSPGEKFEWSFVATVPGVYMYHCGTAPALQHIGNGMYGVMIVDPDPPLPAADREYVLVQSELYYGEKLPNGVVLGDFTKMQKSDSDAVVFNGHQSQYRDHPLVAEPGELVRLYVVDAGPTMMSSFHVVGEIFDRVVVNGNPAPENIDRGVQTTLVPVGGGYLFELRPEQAGEYLFVSHAFAHANKGAVGVLRVGAVESSGGNVDH